MAESPPVLTIRPSTPEDAVLTWTARNNQEARRQSRSTAEIPLEAHEAWYGRALCDPAKRLYVAMWGDRPVGTGRIDVTHAMAEVSIAVLPECRGRGIGTALVGALTDAARRERLAPKLRARARTTNPGSLIAFLRSGYVPVDVWHEDGGDWIALDKEIT